MRLRTVEEMQEGIKEAFLQDRQEAFLSFDRGKIAAFLEKYGILPPKPQVFWPWVHSIVMACEDFPLEARERSREWLIENRPPTIIVVAESPD